VLNLKETCLERLNQRAQLRYLEQRRGVDFYSNDYLGFTQSPDLKGSIDSQLKDFPLGASGSRLLSGNHPYFEETEAWLAQEFSFPSALIFNSGYQLNQGLFATLPTVGDCILLDREAHASIKSGAKLSKAQTFFFHHNDLEHFEKRLQNLRQNYNQIFVGIESVYSMQGDLAPLVEMAQLCEMYHAQLIVDEAHAVGVFEEGGRGLVFQHKLQDKVFATVGGHGAFVLGPEWLSQYLINFCQQFIYTTALPPEQILHLKTAIEFQKQNTHLRTKLWENINIFNEHSISASSAIVSIPLELEILKKAKSELEENNLLVNAIYSPTVQSGQEVLRICLHAFNTKEDIEKLIKLLKGINS
jgi:8-amino-7-oxononanoate synthase